MNPRRFPGLGLVLVTALAPARATAQQRSVSLAEAIELAQKHDPNVVQAQGDVRSAGAETRARYGSFLPSVSAGAGGGKSSSEFQRVDPRTGQLVAANSTTTSVNLQLSAGIDLFTGFRRGAELSAARAEGDRAQAALDARKWQTAFNTSREFFSALQNGELVRVRRDGIRRAEEQLAIAVARLRTRGATVSDSLQAVVEVSQARLRLLTEESQLAQAEANLARAIGVSGRISAVDDSSIAIRTIAVDTAAMMTEARERSPAVVQAEAAVRSAKANLSAAKAVYWPQVQLNGSTSYGGNDQDPLNKYKLFNNRNLGLNISIPLFNGFQREQQVTNRSVALDVARARSTDAAHDVEAQLIGALASPAVAVGWAVFPTNSGVFGALAMTTIATGSWCPGSVPEHAPNSTKPTAPTQDHRARSVIHHFPATRQSKLALTALTRQPASRAQTSVDMRWLPTEFPPHERPDLPGTRGDRTDNYSAKLAPRTGTS